MVWVLFEMLVFNLWPTLPVFYFFSTSSRNFSCNCYKIFCIKPIWCGTKRIFLPLWSLTSGQRLLTTFERCSWYITSSGKKKKKKMLRIFFQILQVADEAYFNKIRCRCVFVLSSLVRTCKSHVQKDAGWCWSLSFSCRNDGWFEAEKDRPCPRKSVQWLPNICVQTFCWLFQSHGVAGGCSQADKTWLPFHYNTVTL